MNQTQVAAALGITVLQLWQLTRNQAFPTPLANDGRGNVTWASGDITAFLVLWNGAKAKGWRPLPVAFPTFPFVTAAATAVGPSYKPEGRAAPELFDL